MNHQFIRGRLAAACLAAGAATAAGPAQALVLDFIDLGVLPGGLYSSATGINNAGQVVGTSGSSTGDRAFVWDNGALRNLGVMANFGGGGSSTANAINAAGQVVGTNTNVFGTHGFVWQNGSFTDLGDLAGGADYSAAYAINALGQVAGVSTTSTGSRAVLWRNGVASNLGDLQGGLDYSAATGVNAAGQVVGHSYYSSTYRYAFLWQDGVISSLGALPGGVVSVAAGLNDAGQVVGGSSTGDGDRAFVWQNGVMRNLGVLGAAPGAGAYSAALAINNAGQVVGISAYDQSASRAFLWSQGAGMVDLQALLPAGTAARVSRAAAVNDSGQIVGTAIVNGAAHAMLLTPGGTLAWQAAGNGSFADGANWELGFVPSRWVDVVIAPAASTTVLGPAAAMGAKTLTVGGAGAGLVTLQLQRGVITLGDGGAQATLAANVTLTGDGAFEGSVSNRGTVAVSNLSVSFGLYNEAGGRIEGGRISAMPGVFNSGLISGNTRIEATVVNDGNTPTTGLRVGAGQHMTLTGLLNTGRVEVQGGELSNSGSVSHAGGTFVLRDAVLRTDQGFENQALITVSFGTSDIHGALGNARGGKIILSGNSNTTFHDAVDARSGSELRVSAGSTAVFFGAVQQRSGAVFSGAGSKFYEGGLSVGASPGLGLDAGNVSFGAGSQYLAEIGGSMAGTQFDHYGVGGTLTFGGTLKLVSWGGYTGQVGDVYDLFDWGQVAGRFDAIDAGGFMLAGGARLDTATLYTDGSLRVVAVPEPATLALWLLGGVGLLGQAWRRRWSAAALPQTERPTSC